MVHQSGTFLPRDAPASSSIFTIAASHCWTATWRGWSSCREAGDRADKKVICWYKIAYLYTHWIGLRENLQETMVFTIKYRVFLKNFPSSNSMIHWLVVLTILKNMKVNEKDYPINYEKMFETTNQIQNTYMRKCLWVYLNLFVGPLEKKPSTSPLLCLSQVFVWNMSSASIAFQDCSRIDYGAEIGCWLLLFQKSTCEPSWELIKLFLRFNFHGFVANRWFCRKLCSDKFPVENELPSSVALPWSAPGLSASFKVGETWGDHTVPQTMAHFNGQNDGKR